ncbi:MAG: methyltransferase domain-containing protein [Candidatus Eisenbacteria sp.]|nr:methyltransferase domain-containing protein [Candidatus Eisenbacteria bacterium]
MAPVRHPGREAGVWDIGGLLSSPLEVHRHFSRIACKYKDLRSTDLPPIQFIREKLVDREFIQAADVGCGAGRYVVELFHHMGSRRLSLICIDSNVEMLAELAVNVEREGFENFRAVQARARTLPLPSGALDAIFTFNAVHHFHLPEFLKQCALALRKGGLLFIYTRFRSQNRRNIWGRFFPLFNEKETRLFELPDIHEALDGIPELRLRSVEYYRYRREAPLDWLENQAVQRHYSTFSLYRDGEFEDALDGFRKNIVQHFEDVNSIRWNDENVMMVIQPTGPA